MLAPEELLYFERTGRITRVQTAYGCYRVKEKLSEIGERLPEEEFVRCHNSFIVYFPAVREMERNCFIMRDGTQILISRSYGSRVKRAFSRWAAAQHLK